LALISRNIVRVTLAQLQELPDTLNSENYGGYSDWRLPNVKELQSIVDYTRSPDTTDSAASDPLFECTSIINEAVEKDYPYYWSGTNHVAWSGSVPASYKSFGREMGYYSDEWKDVHGAGAQRSKAWRCIRPS
jgi:hypothetical protein